MAATGSRPGFDQNRRPIDVFPFEHARGDAVSAAYHHVWDQVPDEDDAQALIDCYYRHFSWK
jgi:hypothetical protein